MSGLLNVGADDMSGHDTTLRMGGPRWWTESQLQALRCGACRRSCALTMTEIMPRSIHHFFC